MITPNPHHPAHNRFFAGLIWGVAMGCTIYLFAGIALYQMWRWLICPGT